MPWSDWITEDYANYPLGYTRAGVDYNLLTGGTSTTAGYTGSVQSRWLSQNVDGTAQVTTSAETAVVYTVDPAYPTALVPVPEYVGNLAYGVDWGANPATGTYVEYEPGGVVTLDHWDAPSGGSLTWDNDASGAAYATPTADGDVRVDLFGSDLSAGWPAYGSGTNLTVFTTSAVTGTVSLPASVPAMPGTASLAVLVRDELNHPAPIPPSGNAVWERTMGESGLRDAQPRGRMPRFRYWIPETVTVFPLRQKQRNDGLARGVLRARSTSSIQNSVRQNSYR